MPRPAWPHAKLYIIHSPSGNLLQYDDIREAEVMARDLAIAYNEDVRVTAPSGVVVYAHSTGLVQVAY